MRSVLEFLQVTGELINDKESIKKSTYAMTTVTRLKSYNARLQSYFNEHPEDKGGIMTLLEQANSQALQLEFYLSRVEGKYYDKRKQRMNVEALHKACQKVMAEVKKNPDKMDEYELIYFVELNNHIYHLFVNSQFYVWGLTEEDKLKIKQVKSLLEEFDHGCFINISCN